MNAKIGCCLVLVTFGFADRSTTVAIAQNVVPQESVVGVEVASPAWCADCHPRRYGAYDPEAEFEVYPPEPPFPVSGPYFGWYGGFGGYGYPYAYPGYWPGYGGGGWPYGYGSGYGFYGPPGRFFW